MIFRNCVTFRLSTNLVYTVNSQYSTGSPRTSWKDLRMWGWASIFSTTLCQSLMVLLSLTSTIDERISETEIAAVGNLIGSLR